jgi:hypothetical protein
MRGQKISRKQCQRPRNPIILFLASFILPLFAFVSGGTVQADFTIWYDWFVENGAAEKPAVAENSSTGDFLTVFVRQGFECPEEIIYGVLSNKDGNQKSLLYPVGDSCSYKAIGRPAVAYSPQSDLFCVAAPMMPLPSGRFRVMVGFVNGDGTPSAIPVAHILDADDFYHVGSDHGALHVVHNHVFDEFVVTVQVEDGA